MICQQLRTALLCSSLAVFFLAVGIYAQQRPASEIAADLERLAAELKLPPTLVLGPDADLQSVLNAATAGSTVRLAEGATYAGSFVAPKPVRLVCGGFCVIRATGVAPALLVSGDDVEIVGVTFDGAINTDTLLTIKRGAKNAKLKNVTLEGNGQTKRGISAQGIDMVFEGIQVKKIGRLGQESQAVAMWDGTGLTIRDSFLEAGSISLLVGGAVTAVPNHVPADILVERTILTHPIEWRGKLYVNKNSFELKNARRVVLRDSTLENNYVDSQVGFAVQLTPTQSGATTNTETIVEDVLIEHNTIHNSASGINAFGFSQHQATNPTARGHNYRIINNTFVLNHLLFGGNATLLQLSWEPTDILFDGNTVTTTGEAFLRVTDRKPVMGLKFTNNSVNPTGTYGVFTPQGSRGTNWLLAFPDGVMTGNTFSLAHSLFVKAFPENTYQQ